MTLRGGSYKFRSDLWFCVTGADMQAELDGETVVLYKPVFAARGQVLSFGEAKEGCGLIYWSAEASICQNSRQLLDLHAGRLRRTRRSRAANR